MDRATTRPPCDLRKQSGLGEAGKLPRSVDAAIAGGGLIGLAVGWRLAARGLKVAILDCGAANAASPMASGMLAAAAEIEPCASDLFHLAIESQRLWPGFRTALEAASGSAIDYRDHGTMIVAIGRDEVDRLRFRFDLQRHAGAETQWLDAADARALEPTLRPSISAGILCPHDHQVEPRRLLPALRRAFTNAGGVLIDGCTVSGVELAGGRVCGLRTSGGGIVSAPIAIIAAGAWSGTPGLLPPGVGVPVRPLKGQSLSLWVPRGMECPSRVVWTDQVHIAPKADRLVVGATVEEAGFDASRTAGGLYALLEATRRILPGFEELRIEALQAGLRPTSVDDAPIIGTTGVSGLVLATGHHRNGYLLAPVTAAAIEALVTRGAVPPAAEPFGLARFAGGGSTAHERQIHADHHQRAGARV
ncbi:MAG: glycine oxidase ThiO [Methylobacteriaceae bacterium]|nr:glycine oxidase ThiO [Methylobacteriaceae bacterium]